MRENKQTDFKNMSILRNVGEICNKGSVMLPEEKAITAYDLFKKNKECSAICIVDEEENFRGVLIRSDMIQAFGGRYGYNLHMRNTVMELANIKALTVYATFSIENVARLAMERSMNEIYDPVVVIKQGKYYGIVTVKDLLLATVSIEVEKANETNPLTSLPGNKVINQKIHQLIGEQDFFAIIYLDLDNFKAFNDAYGFSSGDRMIEILADIMKKVCGESSFLGHIGGDDFVIITRQSNVKELAEVIISDFKEEIRELYNETDWERGYIISQNRKGVTEQFPIAAISIAIITNQSNQYNCMKELTKQIVAAKKSKTDRGEFNCYSIESSKRNPVLVNRSKIINVKLL